MGKGYKYASYRRENPQKSQDAVGMEMGAACQGAAWHDWLQWSLHSRIIIGYYYYYYYPWTLEFLLLGNCDQSPQWGCMRVSSQCRLWRRESGPPRVHTGSLSAVMLDPQVRLVNSWASTCGMDDSRSQHGRLLLGTFFILWACLAHDYQSVHTYSMYPCDSCPALTWFFSRDDGENLLISAKPTTKTVTSSAHSSLFVAPTGEPGTECSFSRP